MAVTYAAPVVANGTAPVATACTVASGASFPIGTTDVTCTVTDADARQAQCVFHVTVSPVPRLQGTSILAFGDSITCCEVAPAIVPQTYDPTDAYPTVLQTLLTERYTAQKIKVTNGGMGAEDAAVGEERLTGLLDSVHPDVLLLLEGVNDVNTGLPYDTTILSLRSDIRHAYERGVKLVLVSTLLPQIPGLPRAYNPDGVVEFNDLVRALVPTENAVLVDSYAVFRPRVNTLIGDDGLHPTVEGHRVLAKTFLTALEANFEETPPMSAPTGTGGGPSFRGR